MTRPPTDRPVEDDHKRMWAILKYFKEAEGCVRGRCFSAAFKVLDDAFGAVAWRVRKDDGRSSLLSSYV